MTPSPEQTQPNLPIEDEQLLKQLESLEKPYEFRFTSKVDNEVYQRGFDMYELTAFIHHYATKRELEALEKVKLKAGWYHELSHGDYEDTLIPISEVDNLIAQLKAQKEQENKGE